ncbi:SGNH/GDSL hydrolase family protein [Moheibacter sediminis]|uniref:GDSL-like Lipase/Acylhydrolase n=1 Tax=Moheibacter sediminis TaxID=1434700 RepID=A0A1W2BG36_9FLAO|nr:hypothetical protein [Moheibacter sediminis]SMC71935.1 GDSL-like Lipase/Acylhydrolase [Moheibacter sediminis]
MKNLSKIFIATSLVVFASCEPDFDEPVEDFQATSGDADFSKYIALGNSLTSGFTDNALFINGQVNSYPNMLAMQMAMAGGGAFTQPLMPDEIGGFNGPAPLYMDGRLNLVINPATGAMGPVATPAQSPLTMVNGSVNNMGVPGAKSFHLGLNGYGNPAGIGVYANPYFVRFASSPSTSVIADAIAQQPTFFSLWIGNNDVLSYATGGGVGVDRTGNFDPTTYGSEDITDPTVLATAIKNYLIALDAAGAKGVIANIPSITDIPYFTTVPHAPLSPTNASFGPMIPALNAQFGQLNAVFDYLGVPERKIVFNTDSASAVVIEDETLTDLSTQIRTVLVSQGVDVGTATVLADTYKKSRQATAEDLIVFTSQTIIGQINTTRLTELMTMGVPQEQAAQLSVNGVTYPLTDKWVLIPTEKQAVLTATAAYNAAIRQLATDYNLAFVDAHKAMQDLSSQSGITYFGNTYTTTYVSGGAFSLDAVHLTGKGYAVVANYFIDAINQKYGSTLRNVNPNNYPGIKIP